MDFPQLFLYRPAYILTDLGIPKTSSMRGTSWYHPFSLKRHHSLVIHYLLCAFSTIFWLNSESWSASSQSTSFSTLVILRYNITSFDGGDRVRVQNQKSTLTFYEAQHGRGFECSELGLKHQIHS